MSPEELVRTVFDRVHASDPSVADLYAADAVRVGQDGRTFEGREAIRGFYESIYPTSSPHPVCEQVMVRLPYVAAVLSYQRDGNAVRYIDLFEVEDGLIRNLWVMT